MGNKYDWLYCGHGRGGGEMHSEVLPTLKVPALPHPLADPPRNKSCVTTTTGYSRTPPLSLILEVISVGKETKSRTIKAFLIVKTQGQIAL